MTTVIESCYIHNDGLTDINVIKLSESIICEQCWIDGNKWTCNHGLQSFHNTENTIDDLLSLLAEMENGLRITIDE